MSNAISEHDRMILRAIAQKQLEHACSEENLETIKLWYLHNACEGIRPMVHLEMWTFQQEVIPQRLSCQGEKAREIETRLYQNFLNHELFHDDWPVPDYFPLTWNVKMTPFGIPVQVTRLRDSIGHQFIHQIEDLDEDFAKLGQGEIYLDRDATLAEKELLESVFGDILPVKLVSNCLYSVPTEDVLHLMGMENMLIAMMDSPDLFHKMMQMYTDDTLRYFRFLENERLLYPTVGDETLAQGSWCFNRELPAIGENLHSNDLWGFMDSQETVGISPDMYGEFIFPYYERISREFGLLSYGCCEPVHPIWDQCISKLKNLRKLSISPWCDEAFMAEKLKGQKIIYHRKPSPNYLGVGTTLDEEEFRKHIEYTIKTARGCTLEITQRDVYTINHDISKARRAVEIIRESIEKLW